MAINKLTVRNYKNLQLDDGLQLSNLNIFIGPNGSGKSNLIGVLKFLKEAIAAPVDEAGTTTSFDRAVSNAGERRMLYSAISPPANVKFDFEFEFAYESRRKFVLELELRIQNAYKKVIINQESVYSFMNNSENPFYFYRCHYQKSGKGVVSVYNDPQNSGKSHFETLSDVPVDELGLLTISVPLEKSSFSPENTPVYSMRRHFVDTVWRWRFYNANNMNLEQIRLSEPKIGGGDTFLSPNGANLPLVFDNLVQMDLDFEERINNAMKAILPATRKVRTARVGRLSLAIEWYMENFKEPFYLSDMSDGTVRMLCWATILHSPVLPPLLVIDEPEIGIHVAWMPILAEWIKHASIKTQVIICTHSPDLLDQFTDQPETVSVFRPSEQDKHVYRVRTLSKELVREQVEEGWQLGDLYRVGDPGVGGWPW